jgi:hypothetical protein
MMRLLRSTPRSVRWTLSLGLLGLAFAVPFSAPDGTGMQWDELVLGSLAASSAWSLFRAVRSMERPAARPWRLLGVAAVLFMTAQWLEAAFPGPQFDGFGIDKVFLFVGATAPLTTCALLARRVSRTRWTALVIDGAVITAPSSSSPRCCGRRWSTPWMPPVTCARWSSPMAATRPSCSAAAAPSAPSRRRHCAVRPRS